LYIVRETSFVCHFVVRNYTTGEKQTVSASICHDMLSVC